MNPDLKRNRKPTSDQLKKLREDWVKGSSQQQKGYSWKSIKTVRYILLAIFGVLLNLLVFTGGSSQFTRPDQVLKIGYSATTSEVSVDLKNRLASNQISAEDLHAARVAALTNYPDLVSRLPAISQELLRQMRSDRPFWSALDYFFFDKEHPAPSESYPVEAVGLVNPLLLIDAEFPGLSIHGDLKWKYDQISQDNLKDPSFPLFPVARRLTWFPKERRAEAIYNISEYVDSVKPYVISNPIIPGGLLKIKPYNAFDFGFIYISLALKDSIGISYSGYSADKEVLNLSAISYIENGCNYKQGCNLQNPFPAYSDIKINKLPAEAVFYLWSRAPQGPLSAPEFKFSIKIE